MLYAIIAVGSALLLLLALKAWARRPAPAAATAPMRGFEFSSVAVQIDDEVAAAERWWPHLQRSILFWVAAFFTAILLLLDFHFGYSRGGWGGFFVLGSLFAAADVAIPIIALQMELAPVAFTEIERRLRPLLSWTLLIGCTAMSCIVVIGSTAELSTTIGAAKDVEAVDYKTTMANIERWEKERDSIPVDRGAKALDELGKATAEAAEREKDRKFCGPKCEKLKNEAADLKARADEARRKERLTGDIEAAKAKLQGGGGVSSVRLDSDPLATAVDALSGGYLPRTGVQRYAATVIGVLLVCLVTIVWIIVGDGLAYSIRREIKRRGAIADEARANLGLPRKYTAVEPAGLLAAPDVAAKADPGITINISAADMRKRYAHDPALLATDGLFDSLLERADGGRVSFADLYRAYQVAVLTADPNARYMTQPTMAAKLLVISQHRDDVRVTADGFVVGWVLKPTDQRKVETIE